MAIKVATDSTFEAEVLQNDKPVVVDFWAAWCGPCKLVAPEMEKLAAKYEGAIDIVKVDVDANPGLSRAFNIMSIPTIAFFAPGKQPMGVVGFRPAEQLEVQFGLASYPKIAEAAAASDAGASPAMWRVRSPCSAGRATVGQLEPGTEAVGGVAIHLPGIEADPFRPTRGRPGVGRASRRCGDGRVQADLDPERPEHSVPLAAE
jgi:thioredoxin 1